MVQNIFMEHDLNILMIYDFFLHRKYKYTCAAYDCFCAAGTHIIRGGKSWEYYY